MRRGPLLVGLTAALALGAGCNSSPSGVAVGDGSAGGGSPDGGGVGPGCATATARAELKAVDLVFMFDRSGSMGDGVNGDPALKWAPVTSALKSFFADAKGAGLGASLAFFPAPITDQCNPSVYYAPAVSMRPLPDAMAFAAAIDAVSPGGETPTLPAIQGAIYYAQDTANADPAVRTVIVLVTDGEPSTCDSSVRNVSTEVAKVAGAIPTYVIGVGESLTSLTMIASEGHTGLPTLISLASPTATAAQFQKALEDIRGRVLSCDLPIPSPPDDMAIDYGSVNVVFSPGAGAATTLAYAKDCTSGQGWHYDDPKKPARVQLCPASCEAARADRASRVEFVFGCATLGGVIL